MIVPPVQREGRILATKPASRSGCPASAPASLYIDAQIAPARISERCEALQVSPLTHQLLRLAACRCRCWHEESGRDVALIARPALMNWPPAPLPMLTPLPQNKATSRRYAATFSDSPVSAASPQQWRKAEQSARTFNRLLAGDRMACLRSASAGVLR